MTHLFKFEKKKKKKKLWREKEKVRTESWVRVSSKEKRSVAVKLYATSEQGKNYCKEEEGPNDVVSY